MDVLLILGWLLLAVVGYVILVVIFALLRATVLALLIHFLLWGIPLLLIGGVIVSACLAYYGSVDRVVGNILVVVSIAACVVWFKFDLREKLRLDNIIDRISDKLN